MNTDVDDVVASAIEWININSSVNNPTNKNAVAFYLYDNYPNPFNPSTTIRFQIPELSHVTLKVYDVLGKEIVTIVDEEKPAGEYEIEFNAETLTGYLSAKDGYASGVYLYRLQSGSFVEAKKMMLIK